MDPFVKMQAFPSTRWKAGKTSGIDRAQLDTVRLSQFPSWARWIWMWPRMPSWEMKVFFQDSLPNMVILLMVTDDCIVEGGGP